MKKGKKKKKKGKKGKKGKKSKKAKLTAGMAEAQFFGAGCLRHISHYESYRVSLVEADGERYIIPLLGSKVPKIRWHARAILLNLLKTTPSSHGRMLQFGAPKIYCNLSQPLVPKTRPSTAPVTHIRRNLQAQF